MSPWMASASSLGLANTTSQFKHLFMYLGLQALDRDVQFAQILHLNKLLPEKGQTCKSLLQTAKPRQK
jgi:hypothetical protein